MKLKHIIYLGIVVIYLNSSAQISSSDRIRVDSLFNKWDNKNSPGVALGIIKDGNLIYARGYGMADIEKQIPVSPDSRFFVASITKQVTAACIALLVLDNKIDLKDDIRKYVPELPDYENTITIEHLLYHISGIKDYFGLATFINEPFDNTKALKIITEQTDLNFSPGEKFSYSNSGYLLLAEIVKRVSGMPIREFAEKEIFYQLGMKNTFYNDSKNQLAKSNVIGYTIENETYKKVTHNFFAHGDGNLFTSINDFYLWDQNFYQHTVGGSKFQNIILTRGALNNGDTIKYSFGLFHGNYNGLRTISHGGSFIGFRSEYIRFPEYNFSVIIFSNNPECSAGKNAKMIADIFLKDYYSIQ